MTSSIGRLTTPTLLFYLLDSELGDLNLTRPGFGLGFCDRSYHANFEPLLAMLDREAELRGINRQALIEPWLYERLHAAGK